MKLRKAIIAEDFNGDVRAFANAVRDGKWRPVDGKRGWYLPATTKTEPAKVKLVKTRQPCQVRECDVHGSISPWGLLCGKHLHHRRQCAGCDTLLDSPEQAEQHWAQACPFPPLVGVKRDETAEVEPLKGMTPYVHPVTGLVWHLEWDPRAHGESVREVPDLTAANGSARGAQRHSDQDLSVAATADVPVRQAS